MPLTNLPYQNTAPALDSETLRRIVEFSMDCIETLDFEGRVLWMNTGGQCALNIADFALHDGAVWAESWAEASRESARQAVLSAGRGDTTVFRGQRTDSAGDLRWWDATVSPLPADSGNGAGCFAVSRDVTGELQREAAAATLAAVAASTADAIIGFDTEGRITAWNRAAEQMFGYTAAEAVGQTYTLIGSAEIHANQREIFQNVMLGHATRRYETRRRHKNGSMVEVSIATSPLEVGGVISGASAVLRDISEQARAAEELRRSAAMMNALVQGTGSAIYMKDTQGRFLLANPVCLAILGKTADDVLGFDETHMFEPKIARQIMADDAAIMQAGVERTLEELVPMDGKIHTFLSVKNPMYDAAGRCIGIMGVSTDITQRKEDEAEIRDLNTRLRRAMQETHHRVKNNLQVISALAEMQAMDAGDMIPVSAMHRIGQHVRALAGIHDLLTHQIKADARNETISTREILDKLMFLLQAMLKDRSLTYEAVDARLTMEQSSSFAMLVSELVSNAVKHGSGEITLTLEVQPPTDAALRSTPPALRLEVCDDGPGFPPDFDPQAAANTGLELIDSLTRWDLRGAAQYENRAEGGARVVVTFPGNALPVLSPTEDRIE